MFNLDAEFRSERCNFNDQKTKSEIKKEVEDSIPNSKKNDIEEMTNNSTESKEDAAKVIYKFQ